MRATPENIPYQIAKKVNLSSKAPDAWDAILEEDEIILWQGAPVKGILFTGNLIFSLLAGAMIMVMAVLLFYLQTVDFTEETLYVNGVKKTELPDWAIVLSYVLLVVAVLIPLSVAVIAKMKRELTFYTLTNKRAFVGMDYNERRLLFHRFHSLSRITKSGSKVGKVAFFFEWKNGEDGKYLVESGFDHIINPTDVYALVLKAVQEAPEK